ncbi:hypothetical protein ACFE04_012753 [Oxalis oulophora]
MPYVRKNVPKKIENPSRRSVTYTKRRACLFSKAADLCARDNVQIAMLVKSLNEKNPSVYSFGHSSVDNVLDAFLNDSFPAPVDNRLKESTINLYNTCQGLKDGKDEEEADDNSNTPFWLELENLDLENRSIKDLSCVAEKLRKLRDDAREKLKSASTDSIVRLADANPDAGFPHAKVITNEKEALPNDPYDCEPLVEDPMQVYNNHYDCSLYGLGFDHNPAVNYAAGPSTSTCLGFNGSVRTGNVGECSKKKDDFQDWLNIMNDQE